MGATTLDKYTINHKGSMVTIFKVRTSSGLIRYMLQASSTQYKTKSAAEAAAKRRVEKNKR